ncbi:MAG: hypothetical protein M3R51_08715 [Candidatus Eremiobacteraeota bacterium]|nr:hypothetical protein [Candidatus Eremiobacteraeota bacterium]
MNAPQPSARTAELAPGVQALPHGLMLLERSRVLVAADAHFGYEDVIGGALPLWSTTAAISVLVSALERTHARELVLLGDIIHGSRMSAGAAAVIGAGLQALRARCSVTLIAGNHEGRTRGLAILGNTEDAIERDGWILIHGDKPVAASKCIVGHLHPSIALGGRQSIPAFLASPRIVVVPALTPYSRGLNVCSAECSAAIRRFVPTIDGIAVTASGEEKVYPFGSLRELRELTAHR